MAIYRFILNFIFFTFIMMLFSSLAFADAVYLKNGSVMKGRIVEKNDQFIVLKDSEGEDAVKTTIYHEDINRIESDEEYSNETKFFPRPWESQAVIIEPKPIAVDVNTDQAGYIKGLIKRTDRSLPKPDDVGTLSVFNVASMGDGSISGSVKLPEEITKYKAPIFVYLAKDTNAGFVMASGLPYQKIEADAITSSLVYYKVEHVGSGTYKVFADWDIAEPPIEKKNINGAEVLVGFGSKGDYTGVYEDIVKLDADENRDNVNIDCRTYVNKDFADASDMPKTTSFRLEDIYYKKTSPKQMVLVLRVKNTGETVIGSLALDVFINDEKIGQEPYILGDLQLNEDKEFDITSLMATGASNKLLGTLRFKFVRPKTGEVELEKDVYMPINNSKVE